MLKQLKAHILCPKCSERHPPSLPTIPDLWARVKRARPDGQWKGVFYISVWISWTCTTWAQWYDWVKMSNNSFQRNCEIKFFWQKNTVNCTVRETRSCHFPRNAFSKEWKQTKKKGQSTVNEQRPERQCPSDRAHYLDPRGKRRCSSTKALALDRHN